MIQRALISVSDKTHLIPFAKQLAALNIDILATGGTAQQLKTAGIAITDVSDYTDFPEIMDGRVKTLHPKIYGGILARRGQDDATLKQHQIAPIDLVVCNLYPFAKTISQANCTDEQAIENIDIGGPSMIRAAAKNHAHVAVVIDPADYDKLIEQLKQGDISISQRRALAQKAFAHTAEYDTMISQYFSTNNEEAGTSSELYEPKFHKLMDLRYGENPHQNAAYYQTQPPQPNSLACSTLLQGKPLSYNNVIDADAALWGVRTLATQRPACVIIKHATPCGVAIGENLMDAYLKAYATDSQSAFGGIIAFNQTVDAELMNRIVSQQFVEVIVAPAFEKEAQDVAKKKPNMRLLVCANCSEPESGEMSLKSVSGGLLVQQNDTQTIDTKDLNIVSRRQPTEQELDDLLFAWKVVKMVKSNAIVYAKNGATLGIGTGQTSRVFSAQIAALKAQQANLSLDAAVMASDAFFPFSDGVEVAAQHGICAVIQPGGSKRDAEVIDTANNENLVMAMTGIRHFRH